MTVDLLASAEIISRTHRPHREHFGPRVELITGPDAGPTAPGLLRGTINPDVSVPLHSHNDPETFYLLDGELEGVRFDGNGAAIWTRVAAGEALHVPPNARHAFRNLSTTPAVALVITTPDLIDFFEQTGRPISSSVEIVGPPPASLVEEFVAECLHRDYWLASPEENAAIGIDLPAL